MHISCAVSAQLISTIVFATEIEQFLYFLNLKFEAFTYLLWLYSLVCVGPGAKSRRQVFWQRGSNSFFFMTNWVQWLGSIYSCQKFTILVWLILSWRLCHKLSHVIRKQTFSICENKNADQLRGDREADQCLCFRHIDSTFSLLSKPEISSI